MIKKIKYYSVGLIITFVFLVVGIFTLSDYGINIDEPIHFERGNAYLDFFLTGRERYTNQDFESPRVSEWKYKGYDTAYFLKNDSGHPPLNGILAAISNRILHEKLGIMGDLEGYHIFEVFVSSLLVFLVFVMTRSKYGVFAGTIASLSMALYPLFYGESHFNIKDPVEASFFAFTVYFFYLGVERVKSKYFLLSGIFCALAFGTKFNIVFFPIVLAPYLLWKVGFPFITQRNKLRRLMNIPKSIYLVLLAYPVIVLGVHFASRPFLWHDSINHFIQIIQYYQGIGTGTDYQLRFLKYGWNFYPVIFSGASTPLVILIFFLIGAVVGLYLLKKNKDVFLLLLFSWIGVTLFRVSVPGSSIYGGVRQIMEYIPPLAVIAGIGALYFRNLLAKYTSFRIASALVLLTFLPLIWTLIQMHPNQNLFLNSLIGGLKGATEQKVPGAGETMGNGYLQGIHWLNDHAEKDARFGFPVGLGSNFPPQFVRSDIKFGGYFSGMQRGGEYMIEMFSAEFPIHRYTYDYLDRFINPVYVKYVDSVPVVKVWKNDAEHTKAGYIDEIEEKSVVMERTVDPLSIYAKLGRSAYITRIEVEYSTTNCVQDNTADYSYSPDGKKEITYPDESPLNQGRYVGSLQKDNKLVYFFPAVEAIWIQIAPRDLESCILKANSMRVFSLKDIRP